MELKADTDYQYDSAKAQVNIIREVKGNLQVTATSKKKVDSSNDTPSGGNTDGNENGTTSGNISGTTDSNTSTGTNTEKVSNTPVAVTTTAAIASGVKAKVKTTKSKTAAIVSVNKTNKKTITLKSTVKKDGVAYDVTAINKNAFAGAKKLKIVKITSKKAPKVMKGAFGKLNTKRVK